MRTFEVFFGKPSFALIVGILFTLAVLAGIFLFLKGYFGKDDEFPNECESCEMEGLE
jgi:hypothetical protein